MIGLVAAISTEAISFQRTPIVTFGYIMQVILSLAIVLGLIYVASKFLLPRMKFNPKGRTIEIKERIGLEPGLSAYIPKAKDKNHLIIAGQKGIALIDTFDDEGEET